MPIEKLNRLTYLSGSATTKRAKDNMGTGYSYGSAVAMTTPTSSKPKSPKQSPRKEEKRAKSPEPQVLRTTTINNKYSLPDRIMDVQSPRYGQSPTRSAAVAAVAPAPKIPSNGAIPVKKPTTKKKVKSKPKPKAEHNSGPAHNGTRSRSHSPELDLTWQMETDTLLAEIDKLEKSLPSKRSPSPHTHRHANGDVTKRDDDITIMTPKQKMQAELIKKREEHENKKAQAENTSNLEQHPHIKTHTTAEKVEKIEKVEKEKVEKPPVRTSITQKIEKVIDKPELIALFDHGAPCERTDRAEKEKADRERARGREREREREAERDKDQLFLTALHTTNPFKLLPIRKESPLSIPDLLTNVLRPSLFPRVPPYIRFAAHDEHSIKVPNAIGKHLKWKLTNITPIVVKRTLINSGFKLVKSECETSECPQEETIEWIGIWGKHMKSLLFRAIKDGQKMNHFPGTFQIGRKDRLWRNLQKLASRFGDEEFGIMPKSYVLPRDLKILKNEWEKYAADNEKWIIKPPASARGTGIKVVTRWTQIPKKRPVVVQRYIAKPYLINGSKFDLRLYVLVTSIHPLRIYMFKDGLARFASVKYNDDVTCLNDRYMHLTNYSINRLSKNYTPNEDYEACEGHKWTLKALFQYLKTEKEVDTEALWDSLKDLVIKTIISGEPSISALSKANVTSRYNCYELFGIDVLLDEDLKPWLLEANISPSLHSASPLDIHVKGPLVAAVLNIAQFQVPQKTHVENLGADRPHKLAGLPYDSRLYTVYLSKEERDKHIIYTNMDDRDMYIRDILSTLTPDDVRHLIQAEDELTQAGGCERVFPSAESHRYLPFVSAKYYNRLFDAWEARYASDRKAGIELLRNLCDIGYHLEVPPVPLKALESGDSEDGSTESERNSTPIRCDSFSRLFLPYCCTQD